MTDVKAGGRVRPQPEQADDVPAERMDRPEQRPRTGLLDQFLDSVKDRREKRKEARESGTVAKSSGGEKLENEGGVTSMELPKGFKKTASDNDYGKYVEYGAGKTKIAYWKRDDYSPSDESAKQLKDILKKPPHVVMAIDPKKPDMAVAEEKEIDPVYDCLNPGRWSGEGQFDINKIQTKTINGKNVIQVDTSYPNGEKGTLIVFDANKDKGTLEHVWIKGPAKDVAANQKALFDSLKWEHKDIVAPVQPPQQPAQPQRKRR